MLGRDSAIFGQGVLAGTGHWNVERFINDSFLVNEQYYSGIIDPVVFENFTHFFDLFEGLSQKVNPDQVRAIIDYAMKHKEPPPSIKQRVGELADTVIGKWFIGKDVTVISENDIKKLQKTLDVNTTAGWVFMFYLLRIPAQHLEVAFMEYKNESKETSMLKGVNDQYFSRSIERRQLGGEEFLKKWRKYIAVVEKNLYPFLIRYLSSPILQTHLANTYNPESEFHGNLNRFIEGQVSNPELIQTANQLREAPEMWKIKDTVYEIASLVHKGKLMETTYVRAGSPTERIEVSSVMPTELKEQYQQTHEALLDKPLNTPQLKLAWERYLLVIDKMLLHFEQLQQNKVVPVNFLDQWSDLGNLAWKLRGRRELTENTVTEREDKIKRFEEFLS